ncbi:hypothetical protein FB451DRAFT_92340 [Mycena latifolia]|nr:hypothetical protein FB451DRAFT_92340 [Mycena latifolia]
MDQVAAQKTPRETRRGCASCTPSLRLYLPLGWPATHRKWCLSRFHRTPSKLNTSHFSDALILGHHLAAFLHSPQPSGSGLIIRLRLHVFSKPKNRCLRFQYPTRRGPKAESRAGTRRRCNASKRLRGSQSTRELCCRESQPGLILYEHLAPRPHFCTASSSSRLPDLTRRSPPLLAGRTPNVGPGSHTLIPRSEYDIGGFFIRTHICPRPLVPVPSRNQNPRPQFLVSATARPHTTARWIPPHPRCITAQSRQILSMERLLRRISPRSNTPRLTPLMWTRRRLKKFPHQVAIHFRAVGIKFNFCAASHVFSAPPIRRLLAHCKSISLPLVF